MPSDASLPALATVILAAHQAAVTADAIASTCIRVSIKKRMLAGEALTEARKLLVEPDQWSEWIEELGLTIKEARRYANFPAQAEIEERYRQHPAHIRKLAPPDTIPTTLTVARATLSKMDRDVERAPLDELARIGRTAEAIKFLFWDVVDVREAALDIALRARARLRRLDSRYSPAWSRRDAAD